MKGWKECKLGDSIELVGGGTPKTSIPEYWNGNIPWLSVVDFNTGKKYVDQTEKSITELGLKNSSTKILNPKDIIISARGTVGVIAVLKREMAFNQSCYGIRNIPNITEQEFLYYLLKDSIDGFKQIAHGGVFDTITRETFDSIDILLPPLPEQKAIAAVLSSLDDKIDLLHRQNKTLEAMAETLFRQWFVEEADEGWEEGKILDYCLHHKDGVKPQNQPNEIFSHYSIPAFDNSLNPVIECGSEIQSNKYSVVQNSFLFSKLNPNKVKRIWLILDDLNENAICSTEFQVVRPKDKKYLFFTYLWLSIPQNYDEIASGVGGTSGSHQRIDPADIFNFACPLIGDDLLISLNSKVAPIFMKVMENRVQIRTLEKLRDTLLPKLMSGEVRVKV